MRCFGLQDFDNSASLAEILGKILTAETLRSRRDLTSLKSCRDFRWDFGRRDFEISASFWLPRFWDLAKISARCRDSRGVFGRRDFEILPRSRRESRRDFEISASFWPPRFWDLAKISARIATRFSASFWPPRFWDLAKISARISTRFWDLGENLGEFLAAEILRSRRDLGGNSNISLQTGYWSVPLFWRVRTQFFL